MFVSVIVRTNREYTKVTSAKNTADCLINKIIFDVSHLFCQVACFKISIYNIYRTSEIYPVKWDSLVYVN